MLMITPFIGDIVIYQHSLFGDYEACPCYVVLAGHAHEDLWVLRKREWRRRGGVPIADVHPGRSMST